MTPLLYIHHCACISPQQTFDEVNIDTLHLPDDRKLKAIEIAYKNIPPGILRRMSKPVRMGIGAALAIIQKTPVPDGIIIGTANAGFEDCFHFLKQIIDYNEGLLTPGSFVQSTPNALAAQVSMLNHNKHYNITHVHHGLAFENALIDAGMSIGEQPKNNYLLGAVDDISDHNYNINFLAGFFKKEPLGGADLYDTDSPGTICGEGAVMFAVNGEAQGAIAQVKGVDTIHTTDIETVKKKLRYFLEKHISENDGPDLLISGENGDNRFLKYYRACEELVSVNDDVMVARFKHMFGEYPTAAAAALWLACHFIQKNPVPQHMIKKAGSDKAFNNILIYNNFKGAQHSFILVKNCCVK